MHRRKERNKPRFFLELVWTNLSNSLLTFPHVFFALPLVRRLGAACCCRGARAGPGRVGHHAALQNRRVCVVGCPPASCRGRRWIAAHAALGYTATDMFLRGRSLASDIPNLDKLKA